MGKSRWRKIASFQVPLVGNAEAKSIVQQYHDLTKDFEIVKPGRTLGAVWIDDFVAQGKNVNLCEACWRKYHGWWHEYNYASDWVGWWAHCDGCGEHVRCNGFYPRARISTVLEPENWHPKYKKYAKFKPVE